MNILNIIGWSGAILYILAYLLLCLQIFSSNSIYYHLLNLLGAVGLIVNAFHLRDKPNLIVNVVWLVLALYAIKGLLRKRNKIQIE